MISFNHKYQDLLQELDKIQKQPGSPVKRIEKSFQACFTAWQQLDLEIDGSRCSLTEIIHLNKSVRCLFLAKVEYYVLHYHAALFCPFDSEAAIKFWQLELQRPEKFKQEHRTFYDYLMEDLCDKDAVYFGHFLVTTSGSACGTILLAKWMALQDYLPHVKRKLAFLI